MTSPFSCSAASSGLPTLFHISKPSSKWGPSSPGQELLCVSRRKFANLDLLRIRHFEKFDFRSDTHGTGLILGKYQTGNRAIWLVDFLYQPSQELSRVIRPAIATVQAKSPSRRSPLVYGGFSSPVLVRLVCCCCLGASWIDRRPVDSTSWYRYCPSKVAESEVAVGLFRLFFLASPGWLAWFSVAVWGPLGLIVVRWVVLASAAAQEKYQFGRRRRFVRAFLSSTLDRRKVPFGLHDLWPADIWQWTKRFCIRLSIFGVACFGIWAFLIDGVWLFSKIPWIDVEMEERGGSAVVPVYCSLRKNVRIGLFNPGLASSRLNSLAQQCMIEQIAWTIERSAEGLESSTSGGYGPFYPAKSFRAFSN